MAVERNEILGFEDFYKPLTSREQTLSKLQALRARPMADVSNDDLFEAVFDTYATIVREEFDAKKDLPEEDEFSVFDWPDRNEAWINEEGSACVGLWRSTEAPREEQVLIDGIFPGYLIDFDREPDGSVRSSTEASIGDVGTQTPHEVTDKEKEAILDSCLAGFSS